MNGVFIISVIFPSLFLIFSTNSNMNYFIFFFHFFK